VTYIAQWVLSSVIGESCSLVDNIEGDYREKALNSYCNFFNRLMLLKKLMSQNSNP
jgi:hypothetical protein